MNRHPRSVRSASRMLADSLRPQTFSPAPHATRGHRAPQGEEDERAAYLAAATERIQAHEAEQHQRRVRLFPNARQCACGTLIRQSNQSRCGKCRHRKRVQDRKK